MLQQYGIPIALFYLVGRLFTAHPWLTVLELWFGTCLLVTAVDVFIGSTRLEYTGSQVAGLTLGARLQRFCWILFREVALGVFLWPATLLGEWEKNWPKLAVHFGIRPTWTLQQPGDLTEQKWVLRNGGEFFVSVWGLSGAARIYAELEEGSVSYRLRMLKPEERELGQWKRLRRLAAEEWANETEDAEALKETPPLQSDFKIERGRYLVDLRVEANGTSEDFGGLVLIVT